MRKVVLVWTDGHLETVDIDETCHIYEQDENFCRKSVRMLVILTDVERITIPLDELSYYLVLGVN